MGTNGKTSDLIDDEYVGTVVEKAINFVPESSNSRQAGILIRQLVAIIAYQQGQRDKQSVPKAPIHRSS